MEEIKEINILQKSKTMMEPGGGESAEEIQQKKAEKTIKNWLEIQKTVKVVLSLEEMMEEQHEEHRNKLNSKLKELYEIKVKSRKIYDDIKFLKINAEGSETKERPLGYYIEEKSNRILLQADTAISGFLFTIRENFDYIPRIVSLIGDNVRREKIESFAELLCNQFYDNILIPNPEQEELLICIYKLLELDIDKMYSSNPEQFLKDSSFMGTFMTVFSKQHDLNEFLSDLLKKVMSEVENHTEGGFDISLYAIRRNFQREDKKKKAEEKENEKGKKDKKEEKRINEEKKNKEEKKETKEEKEKRIKLIEETFKNDIPKTKIKFKKIIELEAEVEEENKKMTTSEEINKDEEKGNEINKNEINEIKEENEENEIIEIKEEKEQNEIVINPENEIKENKDNNEEEKQIKDNDALTFENLVKKIKNEKNNDLKAGYIHILNQIVDDPNTFCKEKLIEVLSDDAYIEYSEELIKKYHENILFIRELVESLIQSLIDKLTTIPYTVRCICKMIDILISKRFPKLPKYLRHSFIGKFLFNKCIFPVLGLENKTILKKIVFTTAQKRCFNSVINIISKANLCSLFTHYEDVEKIVYNKYLLEVIPILNKFYDKLVDLRLPRQLNEYISHAFEDVQNNTFCFNSKKTQAKPAKRKPTTYDYFGQNPDEILHLQSICFTLEDVLFIKELIDYNEEKFKDLPNFENLKKAIGEIENYEYNMNAERMKKKDYKIFFVISKLTTVPKLKEFLSRKKKKKEKTILMRIKDCIKIILKGLNLLDIKDYAYLNMATTNEKFFKALNYSINESEQEDEVPLNWYSRYIIKNKENIEDKTYLENDLKKLYEEILSEEKNTLDIRNQMSSEINAREGINLQCAKNLVEKLRYDMNILERTKKFQQMETLLVKEHTQICIAVNETIINKEEKPKEKKSKDKIASNIKSLVIKAEKESTQYVQIVDANNCEHRSEKFMGKMEGKTDIAIKTHVKKVNNFISKFNIQQNTVKKLQNLLDFIKEDIEIGEPRHEIYLAFDNYKEILRKDILNDEKKRKVLDSENENENNIEITEILDKIEDYIMLKIYPFIFPVNPTPKLQQQDFELYEKTHLYYWIPPKHLGVKIDIQEDEIVNAKQNILNMEKTAKTISDKLNCVKDVIDYINKAVQFNTGKKETLSAEDHIPLLIFIIIQAHPKRFISNIHYITCFFDDKKRTDGVFLKNIVSASQSILEMNAEILKIDPDEFNRKVEEAKKLFKESENKK